MKLFAAEKCVQSNDFNFAALQRSIAEKQTIWLMKNFNQMKFHENS